MTQLDELIETADRLCKSLEKAAESEKIFCQDICHALEMYSWETYKMANAIREIKEYAGG
jgi:hypothetical protein